MRMPTNDSRKLSDDRIKVELVQVMQDIHRRLVNLDYLGHGQRCGPKTLVDISFHGHDRSNLAEFVQNLWLPYIPCMDNQFRALKSLDGFGPQQPVSIRNNANDMGFVHVLKSLRY